jgi:hypothetical protein
MSSAEIVDIVVIYLGGESRLRGVNRNQKGCAAASAKASAHRSRAKPALIGISQQRCLA